MTNKSAAALYKCGITFRVSIKFQKLESDNILNNANNIASSSLA